MTIHMRGDPARTRTFSRYPAIDGTISIRNGRAGFGQQRELDESLVAAVWNRRKRRAHGSVATNLDLVWL